MNFDMIPHASRPLLYDIIYCTNEAYMNVTLEPLFFTTVVYDQETPGHDLD